MPNNTIVSIIIPCYNVESYVAECFKSVKDQTYQNLEIIFVDNNSSDKTLRKLENIKTQHPEYNIQVLQEEKKGAPAARNRGLNSSKGKWIQFLDADDLLLRNKVQHQLDLITENSDIPFIVGSSIKKNLSGIERTIIPTIQDPWLALPGVKLGNTCANLFNREYLEKVNGWNERLKSSQEYDLMFRILQINHNVIFDYELLTVIRERPSGSISQTDILGNNRRRLQNLCQIKDYQLKNNFPATYIINTDQFIFEELRRIYRLAPREAKELYIELFPIKPQISATLATSNTYVILFDLLGFNITQSINLRYQKIKKIFK